MRVLVTGGAGFIGSHVVRRLLEQGSEVRVLDNFSTGSPTNITAILDDVDLIEGDITIDEDAHAALAGCDRVLHLAALPSVPRSIADPLAAHAINATGTLRVLHAARECGTERVVVASSSSVYGRDARLPMREDDPTAPASPYAVSKLAAEQYARVFHRVYGAGTVSLRYFNVFGPRQRAGSPYAAVIPRVVSSLLEGRSPVIYGSGEQSRDFTFVDDVVDASINALSAPGIEGRVFNVARGEALSVNALVRELQLILETNIEPTHEPARVGEIEHSQADITEAAESLGYRPSTDLGAGLCATADFMRRANLQETSAS